MGEMLAGAGVGILGQYMQNQANSAQVLQQENYQTQMSDTAYQRQVTDMKAAGLNPMFAIGSGGASSPAGSVAQQGNLGQAAISGAQAGQQAAQTQQSMQNAATQQLNQNKQTNADVLLKAAQTAQANANTKNATIDSTEKKTMSNIADGVNTLVDKTKSGYKQLWNLFESNVNKPQPLIQYGSPSPRKP